LGDFRGDVEESDNAGISGISDTTNTEQKNGEEEAVKSEENKITDDTESADNSKKKAPKVEENTESEKPEVQEAEPSDVQFNTEVPVDPNAVTAGDSVNITTEVYKSGHAGPGDDTINGEAEVKAHFSQGANAEGTATIGGKGNELIFNYLEIPDGWQSPAESVQYAIQEYDKDGEEKQLAYKPLSEDTKFSYNKKSEGAKANDTYSGEIYIKVVVAPVAAKLATVDNELAFYMGTVGETNDPKLSNTPLEVGFEALVSEEDGVRIAVDAQARDDVYVGLKVGEVIASWSGDENDPSWVKAERTEDTFTDPEDPEKSYAVYTFDPKKIEIFAKNTTSAEALTFMIMKNTNEEETLKLNLKEKHPGYDMNPVPEGKIGALEERDGVKYYTLDADNGYFTTPLFKKSEYQVEKTGTEEDPVLKDRVLIVKVTPGANRKVTGVKAVLTKDDDDKPVGEPITAGAVEDPAPAEGQDAEEWYTIKLSDVIAEENFTEDLTLTLEAETDYKDEGEDLEELPKVHDIEFKGDGLANVVVKETVDDEGTPVDGEESFNESKKVMPAQTKTDDDSFNFTIKPNDGYDIAKGKDYNPDEEDDSKGKTSDDPVVTVTYDKYWALEEKEGEHSAAFPYHTYTKELRLTEVAPGEGVYTLETDFALANDEEDATTKDADWKTALGDEKDDYQAPDGSVDGKVAWSIRNIKINIETTTESNREGLIYVAAREGLDCTVVTGSGVERDEVKDTSDLLDWESNNEDEVEWEESEFRAYSVSEDASFVTLNISSPSAKPKVYICDEGEYGWDAWDWDSDNKKVTGSEGSYTVSIPVRELQEEEGESFEWLIKVDAGRRYLELSDLAGCVDKIKVGDRDAKEARNEWATSLIHGSVVPVTLTAKAGTEFKKITVTTGEDGDPVEQTIDNRSEATIEVTMSDDVTIDVEEDAVYYVDVKYGSNPVKDAKVTEEGVYEIPFGSKDIKATLYKGSIAPGNIQTLQYVRLYDGDAPAATKTSISSDVVTIGDSKGISADDTGVLRLDLAVKVNNKIKIISAQIRQVEVTSQMVLTDEWTGERAEAYELEPDGWSASVKVEAGNGSIAFSDENLGLELVTDASKRGTKNGTELAAVDGSVKKIEDAKKNIRVEYDLTDRIIKITPLPSQTGGFSGVLRFYDIAARKASKTGDLALVEGGSIEIKTTEPAVKGATLEAVSVNNTNTTINIKVTSNARQFDADLMEAGNRNGREKNKLFYRITFPTNSPFGSKEKKEEFKDPIYMELVNGPDGMSTQTFSFQVNPDTMTDAKTKEVLPYSDPKDFLPKVAIVQSTKGYAPVYSNIYGGKKYTVIDKEKELIVGEEKEVAASTKEANYEHTLVASPAQATLYTGTQKAFLTKVSFSDKTGFASIKGWSWVNVKTGVSKGYVFEVTRDKEGNVYVDTRDLGGDFDKDFYSKTCKDLGLKITADTGDNKAKEASVIIPVKVIAGVSSVDFENGNYQNIYVDGKKNATLKVKAVLNENRKEGAAKKKKFEYELGDRLGNLSGEKDYEGLDAQLEQYVTVNKKNGTVTVKKGFAVNASNGRKNMFTVVARDIYSGARGTLHVTVSAAAQNLSRLVIVDQYGNIVAEDGGVLKAEDFYTNPRGTEEPTSRPLYLRALKAGAVANKGNYGWIDTIADAYGENNGDLTNYVPGVKYTSGAKSALTVNSWDGKLTFIKGQAKAVKLSAAAADGSKGSKPVTMNITLQGYDDIALDIEGTGTGTDTYTGYADSAKVTEPAVKYDGAMAARFTVYPMVKVNGKWVHVTGDQFKNLTLKVGKMKKIKVDWKKPNYAVFVKTDVTSTISVTDKTNKSLKREYTISQEPQKTAKGPKIKVLNGFTEQMLNSAKNAEKQEDRMLTVNFKINGKNASAYAGQYVLITPDYTKTKFVNKNWKWAECDRADYIFLDGIGQKIVKIDADGGFKIDRNVYRDESIIPGNYTLIATVGTYTNGVFNPTAKGTSVKVKVAGKTPKTVKIDTTASFTLDEAGEEVDLASGISAGLPWRLIYTGDSNYAKNKIDENGKVNRFREYFEVFKNNNKYYIRLKKNLTTAQYDSLRSEDCKDLQGYVTVSAYTPNGDEGHPEKVEDVLITVTLGQTGLDARARKTYDGTTTVRIYRDSASNLPTALKGVVIDTEAESTGTPSIEKGKKSGAANVFNDADGDYVKIKLKDTAAGTYKVALKVLTENSARANAFKKGTTPETVNDAYVKKYGTPVTATIEVVDPAGSGNIVTFEAADEETGLAFTAYSKNDWDGRNYMLNVVAKSDIAGADVKSVTLLDTADGKACKDGGVSIPTGKKLNEFTIKLEKKKFVAKADGETAEGFKRGGEIEIPVKLTFNNTKIAPVETTIKATLPDPMTAAQAAAAARAVFAEMKDFKIIDLENRMNEKNGEESVISSLSKQVEYAWSHAVPFDADLSLNGTSSRPKTPITLVVKEDKDTGVKTWSVDLSIKDNSKEKAELWKGTLSYAPEGKIRSADEFIADEGVQEKLSDLTVENGVIVKGGNTVDNNYTADMLLADVKKALGEDLTTNLSITVQNFKIRKATATADGYVKAKIGVYDAITKQSRVMYNQSYAIDFTLNELGDLGTNGRDIKEAIDDIEWQDVFYDALKDVPEEGMSAENRNEAIDTAVRAAIDKAIKEATKDARVTAGYEKLKKSYLSGYDNEPAEAEDEGVDIGYKLPKDDTPGKLQFKLRLTMSNDETIKPYKIDKEITSIAATKDGKKIFQSISKAAEAVQDLGSASGDVYTLTQEFDKTNKDGIAAAVQAHIDEVVTGVGIKPVVEITKLMKGSTEVSTIAPAEGGTAEGTVTITDLLSRGANDAANEKTVKIKVTIPANTEVVAGKIVLSVKDKIGTGTEKPVTVNETTKTVTVNVTGKSDHVITITPALKGGVWLDAKDQNLANFEFALAKDNTGAAYDSGEPEWVSLDGNKVTITAAKAEEASTYVKVSHKGVLKADGSNDADKKATAYVLKIEIASVVNAAAAKAALEAADSTFSAINVPWEWTSATETSTVKPASDTAKAAVIGGAKGVLTSSYNGYDISLDTTYDTNGIKLVPTGTPVNAVTATAKIVIKSKSDPTETVTTDVITLGSEKSDTQKQYEADAIMDKIVTVCGGTEGFDKELAVGSTSATVTTTKAKELIAEKDTTNIGSSDGQAAIDDDSITVTTSTPDSSTGAFTATVKFKVTLNGTKSKEGTVKIKCTIASV